MAMRLRFVSRILTFVKLTNINCTQVAKLIRRLGSHRRFGLILPIVYAAMPTEKSKLNEVLFNISKSDELFEGNKFKESFDVLIAYKDDENDDVLWRLSRGLYNMTTLSQTTSAEKIQWIAEADSYIRKALELNDKNYAVQKWSAIILDAKTTQEGTKAKINSLPTFKYHIEQAIKLNPQDPTSLHMLGTYYYSIADLPWYQKKLASALFGKVPDASFEEALIYYNKAEEISPNFYSKNLLMLGKTYLKLDRIDSAKHWLQRAADSDAKTDEDKEVKKEATDLLIKL